MPVNPGVVVGGPPLTPPPLGLIQNTPLLVEGTALPERWEGGVRFSPEVCGLPGVWAVCSTGQLASGNNRRAIREYEPFVAIAFDECSAFGLGIEERAARARRALVAKDSLTLEREFWAGTLNPANPRLASAAQAEVLGYGYAPVQAMAVLTQGMSDAGVSRGMIHCRPYVLTFWLAKNVVRWVGNHYENARGDIVVPGSGYPGTGPNGELPVAGTEWAYGTEMVQVYRGQVLARPATEAEETMLSEAARRDPATGRFDNVLTFRAERMLAAVHNGCAAPDPTYTHVGVSVNTTAA